MSPIVNAQQSALITRALRLRARVFALDIEIGSTYARSLARGWRTRGLAGMASACAALRVALESRSDALDMWQEARALGWELALESDRCATQHTDFA